MKIETRVNLLIFKQVGLNLDFIRRPLNYFHEFQKFTNQNIENQIPDLMENFMEKKLYFVKYWTSKYRNLLEFFRIYF